MDDKITSSMVGRRWDKPLLADDIVPHLSKTQRTLFNGFLKLRGFDGKDVDLMDMFLMVIDKEDVFKRVLNPKIDLKESAKMLKTLVDVMKFAHVRKHFTKEEVYDITNGLKSMHEYASCGLFEWNKFETSGYKKPGKSSEPEDRFKAMVEERTGWKFVKVRPRWLLNRCTRRCLELDMYNKKKNLAIEYNGFQHYEYPNSYHWSLNYFIDQVNRDLLKARLCKLKGIKLITIRMTGDIENEWRQFLDQVKV